jgi:hypothetical protein
MTPFENVSPATFVVDAIEEHLGSAADRSCSGAAVGEGSIAVDDPRSDHHGCNDRALHEHREHVLGADEAAVEQCEARHGHEQHEDRAETNMKVLSPLSDRHAGATAGAGCGGFLRERDSRRQRHAEREPSVLIGL